MVMMPYIIELLSFISLSPWLSSSPALFDVHRCPAVADWARNILRSEREKICSQITRDCLCAAAAAIVIDVVVVALEFNRVAPIHSPNIIIILPLPSPFSQWIYEICDR